MTLTLPPGIAILGNGDNLLLPPGMTDEDRECVAAHKPRILSRLRSTYMNAAGFFTQAPATLLHELRAAPWAAIAIQTTALTRSSQPIRVTRTTAFGDVEWQAYRAAYPEATVNTVPRARVLSVFTEALGLSVWDLEALKQEERESLLDAVIDRKIIVGHNLGFDLSWLLGETTARPSFALDTMILFRQLRPAVLLRPYRWAGFSDQVKQQFAVSLIQRHAHNSGSREYFAACAEMPLPDTSFESVASWCVSVLSVGHLAYAKSNLDLTLQFLHFLLPGASPEQMPGHILDNYPWYIPFQAALVRLAEGHVRGAAFDPKAAGDLMTDLLAEIESASSEVASYKEFAGLEHQLKDPQVGETADVKRALAVHATANGIAPPTIASGMFDRRSLQAIGFDRVPVWPYLQRLRSAKKGIATVEEYRDAGRMSGRLHSVVSFTTVTGRTSSSEPNLQNVPRDGRFRRLFKARPGYAILAADYSAMELRIAAALADRAIADLRSRLSSVDEGWFLKHVRLGVRRSAHSPYVEYRPGSAHPTLQSRGAEIASLANTVMSRRTQVMAAIFQQGLDPHLVTAADFARRSGALDFEEHPLKWVSSLSHSDMEALRPKLTRERQSAKAANFGLLYGMKEQGLHASGVKTFGLAWTLEEASEARRAWFQLYPELHLWHLWTQYCQSEKSSREKWRLWGFGDEKSKLVIPKYDVRVFKTTTLAGRPMAALNELNAALNYQAQGTGADILAGAIAALSDEIAAMMMMPVHDELVFEVPAGSVDAIRAAVEATMVAAAVGVLGTSIPVVVKTSVSQTWSDE